MKQMSDMQNSLENYPQQREDLILKFADESFTILDAVEFEVLTINDPSIVDMALTNRSIRQALKGLPKIKARPGFEERLNQRILRSKTAS